MENVKVENHRHLRSRARVVVEGGFTSMMWALWVYLFLPLFSVIMWGFGIHTFYRHVFRGTAIRELYELLTQLGFTILLIFCALRGWEVYNRYVFGRRNRRKQTIPVTSAEVGGHFGLPAGSVDALQNQKEITWTLLYDEMIAPPN